MWNNMNITEATQRACQEPTLLDTLTWICVWESERVVRQTRETPQWETCFRVCLESVLKAYEPQLEFFGMKYPFKECARPKLRPLGYRCQDCSVNIFCGTKDKEE